MSRFLALFNHRGLNLKGIGPSLVGKEKESKMGLWLEVAEDMISEEGSKSFCRKVVLTRNRSNLAAICPGPSCLLLQVNFPFFGKGSRRSRSAMKSSSFSPKGSLMIEPPLFFKLDFVVLKYPSIITSFPYRSDFKASKDSQKYIFSL